MRWILLYCILIASEASSFLSSLSMKSSQTAIQKTIVLFRNDLRVHDNPLLTQACKRATADSPVLCVYCFDPRHYKETKYGSKKTGIFRAKFTIDAVYDLRKKLKDLGSDLIVTTDKPESFIPRLADSSAANVLIHGEVTSEEQKVETKLEAGLSSSGAKLHRVTGGPSLYHPDDIPYDRTLSNLPDGFTPFKDKVEKNCNIRTELPMVKKGQLGRPPTDADVAHVGSETCSFSYMPDLSALGFTAGAVASSATGDDRSVMTFTGGEDAALNRLESWMFIGNNLKDYFNVRNGMLGESYSSKLSPWLALGCISPRRIYSEAKRYERETKIVNKSTYWLIFELVWRDFYRYFCAKHGKRVFKIGGAKSVTSMQWSMDEDKIRRWKTGTTGEPLVDANMRELMHTGWMSNRGRQNVASYLVLDLGVDWRVGADHFESLLLDHDVCSNYGNWNAAAGLTGGRVNKFNILKQSKDYDGKGEYIRHWLPELAQVPAPLVFQPWKISAADQARYGCVIGQDYPVPLASAGGRPFHAAGADGQYASRGGRGGGEGDKEGRRGSGGRRGEDGVQSASSRGLPLPPPRNEKGQNKPSSGSNKFRKVQHL